MEWRDFDFHHEHDLDHRIAFIASVPRNIPSISVEEFVEELQSAAESSLSSVDDSSGVTFSIEKYQIGSAAEWTQTFAVLVNALPAITSHGADLITWAVAVRQAVVAIRRYIHARGQHSERIPGMRTPEPIVNLPFVTGMCLDHFQKITGDLERISLSRYVRTSMHGISSAGHPGGRETYTIGIKQGTTTCVFVVLASGRCIDHFFIKSGKVTPLPLPDWLEEGIDLQEGIQTDFSDVYNMTS